LINPAIQSSNTLTINVKNWRKTWLGVKGMITECLSM
jgi:hypothetical protein